MLTRLDRLSPLASHDRDALGATVTARRTMPAGGVVIEGSERAVIVVQAGWVAETYLMDDGHRQVTRILVPGDRIDHEPASAMDPCVLTALTDVEIAVCDPDGWQRAARERPAVRRAAALDRALDHLAQREILVTLGRRRSPQRVAHLLWDLDQRVRLVGLEAELPLTRAVIGDTLGLTVRQVGRVIKALEADEAIVSRRAAVRVAAPESLFVRANVYDYFAHALRLAGDAARIPA